LLKPLGYSDPKSNIISIAHRVVQICWVKFANGYIFKKIIAELANALIDKISISFLPP